QRQPRTDEALRQLRGGGGGLFGCGAGGQHRFARQQAPQQLLQRPARRGEGRQGRPPHQRFAAQRRQRRRRARQQSGQRHIRRLYFEQQVDRRRQGFSRQQPGAAAPRPHALAQRRQPVA